MKIAALTDIGLLRRTNQDTYGVREAETKPNAILTVCDGMGGAAAGNVASVVAANHFLGTLESFLENDEIVSAEMMQQAITNANYAVRELASDNSAFDGMGTTLVAIYVCDHRALIANVGDSRAYLIRRNRIRQLTVDHSYVQELVERGKITAEEAANHPNRNLITRAIGVDETVEADLFEGALEDGDFLLLCSDGLCGIVSEEHILKCVSEAESIEDAAISLRHAAYEAGARDNITIVLFTDVGIVNEQEELNEGGTENG